MQFVRITLTRPRPEVKAEVVQLFEELIRATSKEPGYTAGCVLVSHDQTGQVGRVTIWESQELANQEANREHVMAIHAELNFDDRGTLQDWDLESPFSVVLSKAE
jgi:quinol monooxygenase YgiN